jgi:LmbE family N-acetylglucosaminyl deacetylase
LWQIHYEVWSPLPATHYVDISAVMERKLRALDCHRTALQSGPYRHAIAGLNAYRGLYQMDRATPRHAEAFCVDPDGRLGAALAGLALRLRKL